MWGALAPGQEVSKLPGAQPGLWAQGLTGWDSVGIFKGVLLTAVLSGALLGNFENKIAIKHLVFF